MGPRKLKKKKIKCRNHIKLQNLKLSKLKKVSGCGSSRNRHTEKNSQKRSEGFLDDKKYSRPNITEKYSRIKWFSKVREHYFSCLQTVVTDNCKYYDSHISENTLENLSLKIEQHAILACLQSDLYEKIMVDIIEDIKKCTEEKQIHEDVKKLLPKPTQNHTDFIMKTEKATTNLPQKETHSQTNTTPLESNTRNGEILNSNPEILPQYEYASEAEIHDSSYNDKYSSFCGNEETIDNIQTLSPGTENLDQVDQSNYWNDQTEETKINETDFNSCENSPPVTQSFNEAQIENTEESDENTKAESNSSKVPKQPSNENDTLLLSRNQLQKSVEQTLNKSDKLNKQKKDEKERAYIAQILEGNDSADEKFYHSLSDNENESKENIDETNLLDRLEKMRELFGVKEEEEEEEDLVMITPEKPKPLVKQKINPRPKRPTIWRHEKIIQLHKLSLLSVEMTFERRIKNQRLFLKLFGEDSDEEHEQEYFSIEKYRTSCTERISSWVVKYLMPFYHDKKIIGRNVFKSLGHHISDTIIDQIQYPDEWTVKYFVSKFFPPRKRYLCEADILAFQFE